MTLPLRLIGHVKGLLIPGLLVLFAARGGRWDVYLMILFIPSTIYEILRYISLRYRFAADEMIVNTGILFKNERHIPFARIQNIDLVQSPIDRVFKVTKARLETASGGEAEATLDLISLDAVQTLRRHVFADRASAPAMKPEAASEISQQVETGAAAKTLVRIPITDLAILGLIFNRGWALVALASGLAWEYDLWDKIPFQTWIESYMESLDPLHVAMVGVAVAIAGMIALWIFSIIWTTVRFFGYTLERVGDDLRIRCGLLTRLSATVPRHRIQVVSLHETIGHRLMKRVTVRIETAGGREGQKDQNISRKWFIPIMKRADVPKLLEELDAQLTVEDKAWQPLARLSPWRRMKKSIFVAVVLSVPYIIIFEWWGAIAPAILLPLAVWHAVRWVRTAGFSRTASRLWFRSGVLTRKTTAALCRKIQVVALTSNPFDRRWKMATVEVDTAGAGPADHRIHIPYLTREDADRLVESLTREVEHTELAW